MAKIHKIGKSPKGFQRYYNTETKKYHQDGSTRANMNTKLLAVYLYISGLTLRKIESMMGIHNTTILYWVKKHSHYFDVDSTINKSETYEHVEIDEMFTFLKKKLKKSTSG